MSEIYVSYRSTARPFVHAVLAHLEPRHRVHVDYKLPGGVDFREHQAVELRTSDTFLIFVSEDTDASDYQNAEIGAAAFCARFVDGKQLLPVCIDGAQLPRPLAHIDALSAVSSDPAGIADDIERELARRRPKVKVFVSHAHLDASVASRLMDVLDANFHVPPGEVRCTSVPGHQLEVGAMASDVLRRELGSAACVIALLTPSSIENPWVLFELGATWANASTTLPLLAGKIEDKDIPGAFRGMVGGNLTDPRSLDRALEQLQALTAWQPKNGLGATGKRHEFVEFVSGHKFPLDLVAQTARSGFAARRAVIGTRQGEIVDFLASRRDSGPFVSQGDLEQRFNKGGSELYYRLESLELRGFLTRVKAGMSPAGDAIWGWKVSDKYAAELGR